MSNNWYEANRQLWNHRTPLHVVSDFYDVAGFKAGASSLRGPELQELGPLEGKSLLHLQCHFGLDSLSLARGGARVTGVDFSDVAIQAATDMSTELAIPARFVCANVLDLTDVLQDDFDVVFTSFGALGWLQDLFQWAHVVRSFLKPTGFLYLLEFHPQFLQLDEQGELECSYFFDEQPDRQVTTTTYAGELEHSPQEEYWWNHSLSDVITALIDNGLALTAVQEYPYSAYQLGAGMIESAPGQWVFERQEGRIPYMFSLQARLADVGAQVASS